MYENQILTQIPEYKGMGCRRQSLVLTFESKLQFKA